MAFLPLQVPCVLNAYKDVDAAEGRLAAQIQDNYLGRAVHAYTSLLNYDMKRR